MLTLLVHRELGERAEKALLSAGLPAASFAAKSLLAGRPAEPRLVRLIGRALRVHDDPELLEALAKVLGGGGSRLPQHRKGGAGLGLSIARAVAESHGGRLLLENREESGCLATIALPSANGS